ncbi:MAG TPA: histidine phosphatase family protein [Nocardioidaceae bacterium]|nr:histidine phosphatase family protein [Nocardioidaceae bacterium]
MRHAQAADHAATDPGSDAARPLSARGRRDAEAAGRLLAQRREAPALALVSTAQRTRDTWQALCAGMGATPEVWFDRTLYDAGPPAVVELLAAVEAGVQSVLVVGHNPTISIAASAFSDGQAAAEHETVLADGMPSAAMAWFDVPVQWEDVNARRLRLTGVDVPRD